MSDKIVEGGFGEPATKSNSLTMGVGLKKTQCQNRRPAPDHYWARDNSVITIVGLFKTGLSDVDKQQSYTSLKTVKTLLRREKIPVS